MKFMDKTVTLELSEAKILSIYQYIRGFGRILKRFHGWKIRDFC